MDYATWDLGAGPGGDGADEINTRPPASWWAPAYEADLVAMDGATIALTPSGVDGDTSACWEVSTSGGAGARPESPGPRLRSTPTAWREGSPASARATPCLRMPLRRAPTTVPSPSTKTAPGSSWGPRLGRERHRPGPRRSHRVRLRPGLCRRRHHHRQRRRDVRLPAPPRLQRGRLVLLHGDRREAGLQPRHHHRGGCGQRPAALHAGPWRVGGRGLRPVHPPWATAVAPGPADETAQAVAFEVVWNSQPCCSSAAERRHLGGPELHPGPGRLRRRRDRSAPGRRRGHRRGGEDGSDLVAFSVSVSPVNDPPSAADDAAVGWRDLPVTIAVLANDRDPEGDPLSISSFDAVSEAGGAVTDNGDGTLTYTRAAGSSVPISSRTRRPTITAASTRPRSR